MSDSAIKCITLWQPWATLMVLRKKWNETRGHPTKHRGLLGIHAAAKEPAWVAKDVATNKAMQRVFDEYELDFKTLPRGQILGVLNVIAMMKTEDWVYQKADQFEPTPPDEWYFGNYDVGRWAWLTEGAIKFDKPVPYKGSQGFWMWKDPEPKDKILLPQPAPTHQQLTLF